MVFATRILPIQSLVERVERAPENALRNAPGMRNARDRGAPLVMKCFAKIPVKSGYARIADGVTASQPVNVMQVLVSTPLVFLKLSKAPGRNMPGA